MEAKESSGLLLAELSGLGSEIVATVLRKEVCPRAYDTCCSPCLRSLTHLFLQNPTSLLTSSLLLWKQEVQAQRE